MPSSKSVNPIKVSNDQQINSRLTRRSFSSTDPIHFPHDFSSITEVNDNKKNKGVINDQDSQQQNSINYNNNKNKSWLKMVYDEYNPSLTLENTASVARDHLANERTFLAWLRTSLSFISIGVAITQLFRLTRPLGDNNNNNPANRNDSRGGKQLGIVFIILGIIFLAFGISRYFHSQNLMTKGHFPASRGSIVIGTILTIFVLVACFVVIIFT